MGTFTKPAICSLRKILEHFFLQNMNGKMSKTMIFAQIMSILNMHKTTPSRHLPVFRSELVSLDFQDLGGISW
jgi:hypothetical protein